MDPIVYSTTTGQAPFDPEGYRTPEPVEFDEHACCVHSVGYCEAGWE